MHLLVPLLTKMGLTRKEFMEKFISSALFYTACYPGFPYLPGANTNFQVCRLSSFRCVIDIIIRNAHFQCSIEFQIDYNASFLKKNVDLVVLLCLVADTAESQCSDR